MNTILKVMIIGVGATFALDIWAYILRLFNIKSLDYRFLGRWIATMLQGQFFHKNIVNSPAIKHELIIGWFSHYIIGISFAFLVLSTYGTGWFEKPTLVPALMIGVITIIAPFFIMQPAFGFGLAASNLPDPNILRLKSLMAHLIYGIGLFLSATVLAEITA